MQESDLKLETIRMSAASPPVAMKNGASTWCGHDHAVCHGTSGDGCENFFHGNVIVKLTCIMTHQLALLGAIAAT